MDHAAISLARENHIPILVFSLNEIGSMAAVVQQQGQFTIVNETAMKPVSATGFSGEQLTDKQV